MVEPREPFDPYPSEPEPEQRDRSSAEPFDPYPGQRERARPQSSRRREPQRDSWGLRVFLPTVAILAGITLAVMWIILGGYPTDRDKHGTVPVPGAKTVRLEPGDTRLYFQESGLTDGENAEAPPGLSVELIPAAGGEPLVIEGVPTFFFATSSDGDTGTDVFGRVDIPEQGAYRVVTGSALTFDDQLQEPKISIGAAPWAPFGSVGVGALMIFGICAFLGFLPRVIARRRRAKRRDRERRRSTRRREPDRRSSRDRSRRERYDARMEVDRARRGGSGALSPAIRSSGAESPSEGPEPTEPARRGRR